MSKGYLTILIPILILMIYSILNMMNAALIMDIYQNYYLKQIMWFIIGFIILIALSNIKSKHIFKYSKYFYLINVFLLILVLFFGKEVNNARAWFDLKYFSFQPSELMKLTLIIYLSSIINNTEVQNTKKEFFLILKVLLITLFPAILTFLEPDTGAVIIYFIIAIILLFTAGIRYRWFIIGFSILIITLGSFLYLYYNQQDTFIHIFGTNFFYRMDRITDFGSGMQIENALVAVGAAGFTGTGISTVPIYFPEAPTDFVFALSISNFGLLGGLIIICCYTAIFYLIYKQIKTETKKEHRYFLIGFLAMFLYQTIQNIFMNLGLMPIIGITLPFLSYGGTSTLLYFTSLGIIIKRIYDKEKYPSRIF